MSAETEIALIQEKLGNLDENLNEKIDKVEETTQKIYTVLTGNGEEGLVTKVALNKQSISKAWYWLGGISLAIVAGAVKMLIG